MRRSPDPLAGFGYVEAQPTPSDVAVIALCVAALIGAVMLVFAPALLSLTKVFS